MKVNKTNINYFITDHLGSVRVITDNAGNIREQNDYYPFGMRHGNANLMLSANRWGFNGKEKQITQNLNYLDYGARMYDDFIGRWFVQDILQEKRLWLSSYNFCSNNPVSRTDMNGLLDDGYIMTKKGFILHIPADNTGGDKFDVVYSSSSYASGKRDYDESGNKSGIKINAGEVKNIERGEATKIGSTKSYRISRHDKYEITSDATAQKIMNFVDKNTTIEAANTHAEKSNGEKTNIITTSHDDATVKNASTGHLTNYLGAGHTVIRDDHIHPNVSIPAHDDNSDPSGSDKKRAGEIIKYSPNAQFRILYDGRYYDYNQNGIIK